jgi:hypothetical protein
MTKFKKGDLVRDTRCFKGDPAYFVFVRYAYWLHRGMEMAELSSVKGLEHIRRADRLERFVMENV